MAPRKFSSPWPRSGSSRARARERGAYRPEESRVIRDGRPPGAGRYRVAAGHKLPRNQFGQGIKPGTNETVAFWLANSGTASTEGSRWTARSRSSMKTPPAHPVRGRQGQRPDRRTTGMRSIILPRQQADHRQAGTEAGRGRGDPARFRDAGAGCDEVSVHADLVFVAGSGERTAEAKDLDPGREQNDDRPTAPDFQGPGTGGGSTHPCPRGPRWRPIDEC